MSRIAIVGAGLAGLTALQGLKAAGHQVTVFDKSRGSGGRMATKKLGDASWDMGAQFVRAHSDAFAHQLSQWQKEGLIAAWPATLAVADDQGIHPSPDQVERYAGMPRMTGLSRALAGTADEFITATRITTASFRQQQWTLQDEQGQRSGPFDALLLNTPPQQAIPLLTDAPELISLCQQVDMLPCWTLLLTLQQPLPDLPDAVFVHQSPLSWVARNNSKPGRDAEPEAWVLHAGHDWSRAHADVPRETVQQQLLQAFQQLAARGTDQPLTIASQWLHRWLYAIPANPLDSGFVHHDNMPLALCGDWCHSGSLEGAWLSGRQAAHWLNQFMPSP